jgi:hypothetical protein
MLEQSAKAAGGGFLQDSQRHLARILWTRNLGSGQLSVAMSLYRRMSGTERASLFRLSAAHRTINRQYVYQCEFSEFRCTNIQAGFQNAPRPPILLGNGIRTCTAAAC